MSGKDPRFVVGALLVHSKALHVTSSIECHRRYGSEAKTKLVHGVVVALNSHPSSAGKRNATILTIDHSLGGDTIKQYITNSRKVKAGHVTSGPMNGNGLVTASGIDNSTTATTANVNLSAPVVDNPVQESLEPVNNNTVDEVALDDFQVNDADDVVLGVMADEGNVAATETPVLATAHVSDWVRATIDAPPLNGTVPQLMWGVRNSIGDVFHPYGNAVLADDFSPLDFFVDVSSKAVDRYGAMDQCGASRIVSETNHPQLV